MFKWILAVIKRVQTFCQGPKMFVYKYFLKDRNNVEIDSLLYIQILYFNIVIIHYIVLYT